MHPKLRPQQIPCETLELRWLLREVINCVQGLCTVPHSDQSLEVGPPTPGRDHNLWQREFLREGLSWELSAINPLCSWAMCISSWRASGKHLTTSTTSISKSLSRPQGPYSPPPHHEAHSDHVFSPSSYLRYGFHTYKILPGASYIVTEFRGHKVQNIFSLVPLLKIPVNVENEKVIHP